MRRVNIRRETGPARGWPPLVPCLCAAALLIPAARAARVPSEPAAAEFAELQRQIREAPTWDRARLERETLRPCALVLATDRHPVDVVLRRTSALLADLRGMPRGPDLAEEARDLDALRREYAGIPAGDEPARQGLFSRAVALRRRIAFRNPLLDFDAIVFLKHNKQVRGERHMMDQYFGFNAEAAGGVYVLDRPFSDAPVARGLLDGSTVENGRLKGREIQGRGAFISVDLDYDARTLLFAFSEADHRPPQSGFDTNFWKAADVLRAPAPPMPHYYFRPENSYHVFRVRADGTGLTQLTDGPWLDFDPCFLPNGRIAFISSRIGGQCRCGGRPDPTYTLHAMMGDGADVIPLSWHDTNEWHPSVDHDGMIVYTRWDYVDRDSDVAHHLWRCFPDGRNPRSPHGNYPEKRELRPWMELSLRAVPGSRRYGGVAAPHHGEAYGSLVLIDPGVADDRAMAQVRRVTPDVPFPESESAPGVPHAKGTHQPRAEVFGSPWPLSEDYYLCVHAVDQQHYGIFLVDSFGNRELLYRDPALACLDPIPLRPRPRPPVIPTATRQAAADRTGTVDPADGVVAIMNVYESRHAWPPGTRIRSLRVVNLFPKDNAIADVPPVGVAAQSLCRGVLGTVPVEADGSAHFLMPAGAGVYFQLLDDQGMTVQTMRSTAYVHPGETLACVGCHEPVHRAMATDPGRRPLAMRRAPSRLAPEPSGSYPLTFPRLVQPVLDRHCVVCHERQRAAGKANKAKPPGLRGDRLAKNGRSEAFESLARYAWGMSGGNGVALRERQYSVPGEEGARVSKLHAMLARGHHEVKLTAEEMRRIALWLDCNSNFFGAYHDPEAQARGAIVRPMLGIPAWTGFQALVH